MIIIKKEWNAMKHVVYVPLDERPCNIDFPYQLFDKEYFLIERLNASILGYKNKPAWVERISPWLNNAAKDADGMVVSIDMLLYGGLIPSRCHHESFEVIEDRLKIIKKIKAMHPNLTIYAFQTIMRCPGYDGSDAEPDYFKTYGSRIHRYGRLKHLIDSGEADEENIRAFKDLKIPSSYVDDFVSRRNINVNAILKALSLVSENIIDFFVIAQDDSSEYGWTAMDQIIIRKRIRELSVRMKTAMYPGADEVGVILLARMYNQMKKFKPKLLVKYPSATSAQIIPNIEDRYLDTMVKYHIVVSGGLVATSLEEADAVVFVNAPAYKMLSRLNPKVEGLGMSVLRNMPESLGFLRYASIEKQKPVIIADVTYGNGSNLAIYDYLKETGLLFDVAAYGGWNTASNTIGCVIAQGMLFIHNGKTHSHMNFLMLRYLEDIAYQGYVRQHVRDEVLRDHPTYEYDDVRETNGEIAQIIKQKLGLFIEEHMKEIKPHVHIKQVSLPWKRMYEIRLDIEYIK